MTTLDGRPATALVVIGVQDEVVAGAHATEDLTAHGAPPDELFVASA